jgi:Cdc6-like AAA superfamily ATPase
MSLSRFRKINNVRATKKFTDREHPMRSFEKCLQEYMERPEEYLRVLMFYGAGGIGKTRLAKEFYGRLGVTPHSANFDTRFVSLDAHEFDSPIDILISIRNSLKIDCLLFDFALMAYWSKIGSTNLMLKERKLIPNNSLVWMFVGKVSPIPTVFVKKGYNYIAKKLKHYYYHFKEELGQIGSLLPYEIEERLPYFLGLCIQYEYSKKSKHPIFIFDAHETMFRKFSNQTFKEKADAWLKEFIAACGQGLFIVTGREHLRWGEEQPDWEPHLEQHILGSLSDEDAHSFLQEVPIPDEEIRQTIVEVAKGVPLYLDLCVNIYLRKSMDQKQVTPEDFAFPMNQVVDRFLQHLEREEREILKLLSQVSFFDFQLFSYLNQQYHIGYPASLFFEHTTLSLINELDAELGLYKIHDHIREHLRNSLDPELKAQLIREVIHYFAREREQYDLRLFKKYIGNILANLEEPLELREEDMEQVLSLCLFLQDRGYWTDLEEALESNQETILAANPELKDAFIFLRSMILRRTGSVQAALKTIEELDFEQAYLGRFNRHAEFQEANYTRLLGAYDEAEKKYQALVEHLGDQNIPIRIKAGRQYADLLFLRGKFRTALDHLDELLELLADGTLEDMETQRIKGHIFRFNYDLEKADAVYSGLLQQAQMAAFTGLEGKLLTNLTETHCWEKQPGHWNTAPSRWRSMNLWPITLNSERLPLHWPSRTSAWAI